MAYTDNELREIQSRKTGQAHRTRIREKIAQPQPGEITTESGENAARADYKEYLQTDQWKVIRRLAIAEAGNRCQLCNDKARRLEVHHRTYERRGREELQDLTVLCGKCHGKHHGKEGKP